ncbi:hypothetical protein ENTCAN_09114 [Enterobacter cancerogenus ATCC 35316]|nr:hypothetical protein ENTCAN_09114 [Enterobacter cancerogenus ATCC 35316]
MALRLPGLQHHPEGRVSAAPPGTFVNQQLKNMTQHVKSSILRFPPFAHSLYSTRQTFSYIRT